MKIQYSVIILCLKFYLLTSSQMPILKDTFVNELNNAQMITVF